MLTAGDEFGRTQRGNNNAYCQDNEISWLDWNVAEAELGRIGIGLVSRLVSFRKLHRLLTSPRLPAETAQVMPDINPVDWLDERNLRLSEADWENGEGRALVVRYAGTQPDGMIEIFALMMNASDRPLEFELPGPFRWQIVVDTADLSVLAKRIETPSYMVQDRAAVLIEAVGASR